MILPCCGFSEFLGHGNHLRSPVAVGDLILSASSFPLAPASGAGTRVSSLASRPPPRLSISSAIPPSKPPNAASATATATTRKKSHGVPLPSLLRALDSDEQVDGTLDALAGRLSPKELTVVLREQKDWRRALRVFRWMRSQKDYAPNPIHYNVLLRTLGRAREWDELRLHWIEMAKDGVFPTNNTYATLIDVYGKAGLVKEALLWLRHMRTRGVSPDEVTMNTILRILKDSGQFDRAEKFFKGWCGGGSALELDGPDELDVDPLSPKHFLLTELFKSGGRAPPFSKAEEMSSKRPRLAATYNTLIDLYGKAGRLEDASDAFSDMLTSGVVPDTTTFNTMIHICGSRGHLSEAEALLSKMEERRVVPDTKTFNIFMSMYASVGSIESVLMHYRKIRDCGLRPDVVTHRIILQVLCARKMVQEVEGVIGEMEEGSNAVRVDEQSLPVVMKMYINEGLLDKAKSFFEKHCSGRGGGISSKNYAAIIDAYAEKGLWKEAEDVFSEKRRLGGRKDITEYNVMIKAYGRAKLHDKALSLFQSMKSSGTWPDECTYNSLIQMLSGCDLPDRARDMLTKMVEAGLRPRCESFSAVIASSIRAGLSSEAVDTYHEMKRLGIQPNEVVYGSLIDAFAESGEIHEALRYFHVMEGSGIPPNRIVLTSLIKAYSKVGCWREAQELYGKMKDVEGGPDVVASNSMISLYANLGMVSEAKILFDDLRRNGRADAVSYAIMMFVYKNMGRLDEAIEVAQEMQRSGLLTNCSSFNNAMSSYAANGQLRECGELLHQMLARRILPDGVTFKLMFTVLKKGGFPFETVAQLESSYSDGRPYARQAMITAVFSVVGLHAFALESCEAFVTAEVALDSFAFNVAIYAYGMSGEIDKALNLFMRMQDEGLKPDLVTYINLAGCYGKAGLVEGVKRIYSKLKYGEIEPNESLFKAVMDAYNDAGKPDLAELVNQEMRFSLHVEEQSYSDSESDQEEAFD